MKKLGIVIMLFALMAFSTGQLRFFDDFVPSNNELEMHFNVNNPTDDDIDNIRARAYVLDTGDVFASRVFDLEDGDSMGQLMYLETAGYEPGEYLVRFVVYQGTQKEVTYRYVNVY